MRYSVLIISPPGYTHSECFREVAETINDGLIQLGFASSVTKEIVPGTRHIVFGANLLTQYPIALPADSILYNLEQVKDNELWVDPQFLSILRSYTIWDYSPKNVEELKKFDVRVSAVLPVGFYEGLTRISHSATKAVDVVFVGSMNDRRRAVLIAMQDAGLRVGWLFNSYGAERDAGMSQAKVLLNMHYHKAKILEEVRISYYLANKFAVLSEHSSDPELDAEWAQGVVFAAYEDLVPKALELCSDDTKRNKIAAEGFEFIRRKSILSYLQAALD
jgi:hypothetical protein